MEKQTVAERLKFIRKRMGLSQQAFANVLGITGTAVGYYETGRMQPGGNMLAKIVNKTGVSADWIIGAENETFAPAMPKNADELMQIVKECIGLLCESDRMELIWILSAPGNPWKPTDTAIHSAEEKISAAPAEKKEG